MFDYVDRAGAKTPPRVHLDRGTRRIQPIHGQSAEVFDARIEEAPGQDSHAGIYARFLPDERITYSQSLPAVARSSTYNSSVAKTLRPERTPVPPQSPDAYGRAGRNQNQEHRLPSVERYGRNGELSFIPPKLTEQDRAQVKSLGLYIKHHSLNPLHRMNPVVTEATYNVNMTHRLIHIIDDSGSMASDERDGKEDTR